MLEEEMVEPMQRMKSCCKDLLDQDQHEEQQQKDVNPIFNSLENSNMMMMLKEHPLDDNISSESSSIEHKSPGLLSQYPLIATGGNSLPQEGLVNTTLLHILCTQLPKHWRSNKSLPTQFRVISLLPIPDGTRIYITAGNEERPHGELKNASSFMHNQEAKFNDLRFLGRSGRGKSFNVSIHIDTEPVQVAVYMKAIKVTVDGPRVPRNKNGLMSRQERSKLSSILEMKQLSTKSSESKSQVISNNTSSTRSLLKERKRKYAQNFPHPEKKTNPCPGWTKKLLTNENFNQCSNGLNNQLPVDNGVLLKSSLDQVIKMLMKNIQTNANRDMDLLNSTQDKGILTMKNSNMPSFPNKLQTQHPIGLLNADFIQKPHIPQMDFYQRLNEINKIAERILSPILNETHNVANAQSPLSLRRQNFLNVYNNFQTQQSILQNNPINEDDKYQTNSSSPVTSNESPTIHESPRKLKTDPWDSSSSSKGFFVQNVLSPESSSPEEKNHEYPWEARQNPSKFDMAWQKA